MKTRIHVRHAKADGPGHPYDITSVEIEDISEFVLSRIAIGEPVRFLNLKPFGSGYTELRKRYMDGQPMSFEQAENGEMQVELSLDLRYETANGFRPPFDPAC